MKTVIDGHSGGSFAALTFCTMLVGTFFGVILSSSLFQVPILGKYQIPPVIAFIPCLDSRMTSSFSNPNFQN